MKHLIIALATSLALGSSASAQLANVWHIPGNTQAGIPATMRDPSSPEVGQFVTFYQGVFKGDGANQTGGALHYRMGGGAWKTTGLSFHSNYGSNQFWKASVTLPVSPGLLFEYFFAPAFDNRTSPTYIYGNNLKTEVLTTAQGAPTFFTILGMSVTTASTGSLSANYTTSKLYLDEVAAESTPITISYSIGVPNVVEAEVWTNLNNRERADDDANSDSVDDGIIPPSPPEEKPPGYVSGAYPANGYFQAIPMTGSNGIYSVTLNSTKTGAYRLTARYRIGGNPTWNWYSSNGRRDHCITAAPQLSRNLRIYEVNVLNVDATGSSFGQRSTFESLTDNTRWNLDFLKASGSNTIWFQPIHPNGIEGREAPGGTPYDPGSPYAVKNFFAVMEQMSQGNTRSASMTAFQSFMTAADTKGVHVILDAPFNHSSFDCEIDQIGLNLFSAAGLNTAGWNATDKIKDREARFYSSNGGAGTAYSVPASSAGDVASAPDRNDFGKWSDVKDVFFGRYATLVTGFPDADTSRNIVKNESDTIDMSSLTGASGSTQAVTRAVWKYFAAYVPYWLEKSGLPANSPLNEQTFKGIDGLRADFGQGMPPQFWEYAINIARTHKWSFVFMTESLDGGEVTYRSNRHFELLNENIVFPLQSATNTTAYRDIFEDRRNAYGQGLVLLNNTSHDEAGYGDPWQAFIRYAVGSMIDGAPMVMYGQEIGTAASLSFDHYELNFGKSIPHFKRFNSMQSQWTSWGNNTFGVSNLIPAYSGVGLARDFSPALRSSNRWFLNPINTTTADPDIFATAKYQTPGASPANSDVVLAFQNLDRTNQQSNTFGIPVGLADAMGLQLGRLYNAKNIAAYLGPNNEYPNRRNTLLWGAGYTRSDLLANGVPVILKPVPTEDAGWATDPFEAQYLKLYDVTAPTSTPGQPSGPNIYAYSIGDSVKFDWPDVAADAGGVVPSYQVTVTINGISSGTFITPSSNYTVVANVGDLVAAKVRAVNPVATENAGPESDASTLIKLLSANADEDGDGQCNGAEDTAGTNPLSGNSVLKVMSSSLAGSDVVMTVATVIGKKYQLETSTTLAPLSWSNVGGVVTATGTATVFTHANGAGDPRRFYRARVVAE